MGNTLLRALECGADSERRQLSSSSVQWQSHMHAGTCFVTQKRSTVDTQRIAITSLRSRLVPSARSWSGRVRVRGTVVKEDGQGWPRLARGHTRQWCNRHARSCTQIQSLTLQHQHSTYSQPCALRSAHSESRTVRHPVVLSALQ
jgi:hypothetical protein